MKIECQKQVLKAEERFLWAKTYIASRFVYDRLEPKPAQQMRQAPTLAVSSNEAQSRRLLVCQIEPCGKEMHVRIGIRFFSVPLPNARQRLERSRKMKVRLIA